MGNSCQMEAEPSDDHTCYIFGKCGRLCRCGSEDNCCGGKDVCCGTKNSWEQLYATNTYSLFATFPRDGKGCCHWMPWLLMMWIRWIHVIGGGVTWVMIALWFANGDVTEVTNDYYRYIRVPVIIPTAFLMGLIITTTIDLIRRPTTAPWQLFILLLSVTGFWLEAMGHVDDNDNLTRGPVERTTGFYMGYGSLMGYALTVFLHAMTPYVQQRCGKDIGPSGGYSTGKAGSSVELSTVSSTAGSISMPTSNNSYSGNGPSRYTSSNSVVPFRSN